MLEAWVQVDPHPAKRVSIATATVARPWMATAAIVPTPGTMAAIEAAAEPIVAVYC
jgi:hypothetical protein